MLLNTLARLLPLNEFRRQLAHGDPVLDRRLSAIQTVGFEQIIAAIRAQP